MSARCVRRQSNQRGMALIVTLMALVVLLVAALGVLQTSVSGLRLAGNDRTAKSALAIAEAGAEYARETLRVQLRSGSTLNQKLTAAANNGNLVDATAIAAFGGSSGLVNKTTNMPLVAPTQFGAGSFQVFFTNDRAESGAVSQAASVQSKTDTNQRIMISAFGSGPGGSLATVQEQLRIFDGFAPGPSMPGVIVLPGPTVSFQSFSSNARQVSGVDQSGAGCFPTVSVSTNAAKTIVDTEIQAKRPNNYQSCPPFTGPATENFLPTASNPYDPVSPNAPLLVGDKRLISVPYLKMLVANVKAAADFRSLSDPGFTLGSTCNPKIVALDGDVTFSGNPSGAGVLLVTGKLTFKGTPSYQGVVLVIGAGNYEYDGNGNGQMLGTTLVANINTPWTNNPAYVGVPTYLDNGGGNSTQRYDTTSLSKRAAAVMPLQIISFQQLR